MSWTCWVTRAATQMLVPRIVKDLGLCETVSIRVISARWKDENGQRCLGSCHIGDDDRKVVKLYPNRVWYAVDSDAERFVRRLCNTIAHEFRHAWQHDQGIPYDWDIPYWDRPSEQDAREYGASAWDKFALDANAITRRAKALRRAARATRRQALSNPIAVEIIEARRWTGEGWRYWRDCVKAKHDGSLPTVLAPEAQHAIVPHGVPP